MSLAVTSFAFLPLANALLCIALVGLVLTNVILLGRGRRVLRDLNLIADKLSAFADEVQADGPPEMAEVVRLVREHDARRRQQKGSEARTSVALSHYPPATWRGTTAVDAFGQIGLSFGLHEGSVLRLRLRTESAQHLQGSLSDMLQADRTNVHPVRSSGRPSFAGLPAADGQVVDPDVKSSRAEAGL